MLCILSTSVGWKPALAPPLEMGITVHQQDLHPHELLELREAGLRIIRTDLYWSATETRTGRYDFTRWARLLQTAESLGMQVQFVMGYSHPAHTGPRSMTPPRSPTEIYAYSNWVAAAVSHFQGHGVVWEIWNEPNFKTFWVGSPSATEYARLASASVHAIRRVSHEEVIQIGNLSGLDLPYTREFVSSYSGPPPDLFAIHPYPHMSQIPTYTAAFKQLTHNIQGWSATKISCGEWGWTTFNRRSLETEQSLRIVESIALLRLSGIERAIWYSYADKDTFGTKESGFGFKTNGCLTRGGKCTSKEVLRNATILKDFATLPLLVDSVATGLRGVRFSSPSRTCTLSWPQRVNEPILSHTPLPTLQCRDMKI